MKKVILVLCLLIFSCSNKKTLKICNHFNKNDIELNESIILNDYITCNFNYKDTIYVLCDYTTETNFIIFNKNDLNFGFILNLDNLLTKQFTSNDLKQLKKLKINIYKKALESANPPEDSRNFMSQNNSRGLIIWTESRFIYGKIKNNNQFYLEDLRKSGILNLNLFDKYIMEWYNNKID